MLQAEEISVTELTDHIDRLDPSERQFLIAGPRQGLRLFLRYLPPISQLKPKGAVLYIHGMSFSSAISIAWRADGRSWRDSLCEAGFESWGLDFYGYGGSDRYAGMSQPQESNPALGDVEEASWQIERAVRFICEKQHLSRISIIAHSGGTIATGRFATRFPELIDRVVFFAPIARRDPLNTTATPLPAWRLVSLKDQWERFIEDVPGGEAPVLSERHFREWGQRYLASDAESGSRSPASVKVPNGIADGIRLAWNGQLGYDPADIRAPIAIIRGEWDSLCTDIDAAWLFRVLRRAPVRRDVKIGRATHLMHLETGRFALYREAQTFLEGEHESMSQSTFVEEPRAGSIAGYDYGKQNIPRSPVSLEDLKEIEATVGWTEEDAKLLQRHGETFMRRAEEMVDAWRALIARQPHLAKWFLGPDGKPDDAYKAKVKERFVQWVKDACFKPHDQAWLDYQEEIGRRHTPEKKNQTDGARTPSVVPLRYLIAFTTTMATTTRKFLADAGVRGEELELLTDAWAKALQLHVTLWARPYAKEGLW
jgi:pimeloyl-ACP methyl ester carboxylesterase